MIRTLSEKRLERLLTNEHGRSELLRNARRDVCTTTSVQLTHMEAAQDSTSACRGWCAAASASASRTETQTSGAAGKN